MYRFQRQFDQRKDKHPIGPSHVNLLLLLIAAGAMNFGISLVNWLMHLVKIGRIGDFIVLCFLVGMVSSLVLILGPAFHLNVALRRLRADSNSGIYTVSR
jgi:hypothetical protein